MKIAATLVICFFWKSDTQSCLQSRYVVIVLLSIGALCMKLKSKKSQLPKSLWGSRGSYPPLHILKKSRLPDFEQKYFSSLSLSLCVQAPLIKLGNKIESDEWTWNLQQQVFSFSVLRIFSIPALFMRRRGGYFNRQSNTIIPILGFLKECIIPPSQATLAGAHGKSSCCCPVSYFQWLVQIVCF